MVSAQLLFFLPTLDSQLMFLRPFRGFIDPQVVLIALGYALPTHLFPSPALFAAIYWATVIAGVATLIGFFTRSAAFLFATGNWIMVAHSFSYGEDHHPEAILCIFLMLLAFSPSGMRLSVDAAVRRWRAGAAAGAEPAATFTAIWPMKLTQWLLCFAYVSTGMAKVVYGGLQWINGYTLQQIIFSSATWREIPLGIWLAQYHTVCMVLSIGVVLFEVFFFVALLAPRTLPLFLAGGAAMHLGIHFFEGSSFFQYLVLYAVFIDFERLYARVGFARPRLSTSLEALESRG